MIGVLNILIDVGKTQIIPTMLGLRGSERLLSLFFYGSLNSQGWFTLQLTVQAEAGITLSEEEAKRAIKAWRDTYHSLYALQKKLQTACVSAVAPGDAVDKAKAAVRGFTGRRCFMDVHPNKYSKRDTPKMPDVCAFYWVSAEADIIKLAMAGFLSECDQHPEWEAELHNVSHDELDASLQRQVRPAMCRGSATPYEAGDGKIHPHDPCR